METINTNTEHPHYLRFALETTSEDCKQLSVDFIGNGEVIVHALVRAMQTNDTIAAVIIKAATTHLKSSIGYLLTKED